MAYGRFDSDSYNDIDADQGQVGGDSGFAYPAPDYAFLPGYVFAGFQTTQADEVTGQWADSDAYSWHGGTSTLVTDPAIFGNDAAILTTPFGYGGVESNCVENFEMTGAQVKPGYRAATGAGPVGNTDYSAWLGAAYVQDNQNYPGPDVIAANLITGV